MPLTSRAVGGEESDKDAVSYLGGAPLRGGFAYHCEPMFSLIVPVYRNEASIDALVDRLERLSERMSGGKEKCGGGDAEWRVHGDWYP